LYPEVRSLIKLLPTYNATLAANKEKVLKDMSANDQVAIMDTVAAAKLFAKKFLDLYVSSL
jgi:hypothetical protein